MLANRSRRRIGKPFDPRTPLTPPSGLHSWVHYGVMAPGLPEPHRTFGVMSIVGTPGVAVFANDWAITTSPRDTAYLVSASASMHSGTFHTYSVAESCQITPGRVRFGDDLAIDGDYPEFTLRRTHPDGDVTLRLHATDKVTWFVDLPGGLYDHWSLLCEYDGTLGETAISGLCTFEYARGVGLPSAAPRALTIPARFFTYHVLNVDERTQLLFGETQLLGGVPVLRDAYVRGLDDYGAQYSDVRFTVTRHEPAPRFTPDGRRMRLPAELALTVRDDRGAEVATLTGRTHADWAYGLGAGFVGSYAYEGSFRGRPVSGTAYLEYVDLR